MTEYCYPVVIQTGEDGHFVASCPALAGCHTQGASIPEAIENIREAIALCVEDLLERGERPPAPGTTLLSEVVVTA